MGADMMKVHEIATKHGDIFGHPEDESDSANAMRALFGLEEEETERSMLGGKGFKGMLGSKTAYLSRSALPKDVDNPRSCARSLPACRMPSNCSTSTASPTNSTT